jgi:hypothetical protein
MKANVVMNAIDAQDLVKKFGDFTAVGGVTFGQVALSKSVGTCANFGETSPKFPPPLAGVAPASYGEASPNRGVIKPARRRADGGGSGALR